MRPWSVWCRWGGGWRQVGQVNADFQRQAVTLAQKQFAGVLVGREWHVNRDLTEAEACRREGPRFTPHAAPQHQHM
jgi:hypothetical protein